ncbi:phragmoplast orienting kinesin 2 [Carex littledalei]|uniref:Phragmoplast orienting kinesin 2 n=1 Tax=Carex littledalei TaxID=544730 RepID=A0A833VF38_9POAL|nr:phragmoplast orienting kinesin 2 [Carex littledalei]
MESLNPGVMEESTGTDMNEDPSFWKENNIQVIIRIRPLNTSEISLQGHNKCIRQDSGQSVTWNGHPESRFTFDLVADEHVTQEKEIRNGEKLQFMCKCSFLEIYNEQIFDLLDPVLTNLQIRDPKKGVHVENLTEVTVSSASDAMQQLIQGAANRKVAATNMNRASSRSHSIFTCIIESKWENQGITHHRFARLNLVDLAGSERQKSSGAEGERLKEATNINKSLSTLGLVIMNLVSNKKSAHVPYRDSKLTFLLQDSLGGNSKTLMIANISPSNCCALETVSTLKFAQRAKYIKNNAIINEDASGDVLSMRLQIQQLKKEVTHLRGLLNNDSSSSVLESPGILKLNGSQGYFSPLTFDKRLSQKKECEAALVAAIQRDQEKEASLRAMEAARHTAEDLASQRMEEVRSLKMRLRFREDNIKRLQAVASSKLSTESHLLMENQELRKEIEILKNQLDRNPEVTRFAMENLHLKEELRRLHSFVDEGERERMNEQITVLQDKLLEALDWKLMHDKDPFFGQSNSFSLESAVNEENEFLRLQAIQNEHETEFLRKKLNLALEVKGHLERCVEELTIQVEDAKSSLISKQEDSDPEMELKAMVHAISAASQREAEAHETTISLAKENEDLKLQLSAIMEDSRRGGPENFEVQLREMHQENEKLLGLYEDAMHERDELGILVREMKEREECVVHERDMRRLVQDMEERNKSCLSERNDLKEVIDEDVDMCINVSKETLQLVGTKLELVQDKLLSTDKAVGQMQLIEDASSEIDELSTLVKSVRRSIEPKEESLKALRSVLCQKQGKRVELENLFSILVSQLDISNSKACYLEQRETCAMEKVIEIKAQLNEKEKELRCLQTRKEEIDSAYKKTRENESKLRNKIDTLKTSLKSADDFRKETEKVLFEVNNLRASDLLNSEMQRHKLVGEMNYLREQMGTVRKEIASLTKSREAVESKISGLEVLMSSCSLLVRELEGIVEETRVVGSTGGHVKDRMEKLLPDYQEVVFEVELKNEEIGLFEESLQQERSALDELSGKLSLVIEKLKGILCQRKCVVPAVHELKGGSICLSEMVAKQLQEVCGLVNEAKQLSVVGYDW